GNRLDLLRMTPGAIEADGRAPIVQDQRHVSRELQRLEPSIHVTRLIDETIDFARRLARPPHAHEIRRETPANGADVRNDVAPLVRPRGIAMEKDDRLAFTYIDIADLGIQHLHATPTQVVRAIRLGGGGDRIASRHIHNADAGWREP